MKEKMNIILGSCFLMLLSAAVAFPVEAQSETIRAKYLQNSSMGSVLELTIGNPAPSSVIVKQRLPKGTGIKSVNPGYSKFSKGKNEATWLFKRPAPGVKRIVVNYTVPAKGGGATAVIRCKSPRDGSFMTVNVQ